jgi:hypothetical protein
MAQFLGSVEGRSGKRTTRLGSKASGLCVRANGRDCGIRVSAWTDRDGVDRFDVYLTGGSNGHTPERYIGSAHLHSHHTPVWTGKSVIE